MHEVINGNIIITMTVFGEEGNPMVPPLNKTLCVCVCVCVCMYKQTVSMAKTRHCLGYRINQFHIHGSFSILTRLYMQGYQSLQLPVLIARHLTSRCLLHFYLSFAFLKTGSVPELVLYGFGLRKS